MCQALCRKHVIFIWVYEAETQRCWVLCSMSLSRLFCGAWVGPLISRLTRGAWVGPLNTTLSTVVFHFCITNTHDSILTPFTCFAFQASNTTPWLTWGRRMQEKGCLGLSLWQLSICEKYGRRSPYSKRLPCDSQLSEELENACKRDIELRAKLKLDVWRAP